MIYSHRQLATSPIAYANISFTILKQTFFARCIRTVDLTISIKDCQSSPIIKSVYGCVVLLQLVVR